MGYYTYSVPENDSDVFGSWKLTEAQQDGHGTTYVSCDYQDKFNLGKHYGLILSIDEIGEWVDGLTWQVFNPNSTPSADRWAFKRSANGENYMLIINGEEIAEFTADKARSFYEWMITGARSAEMFKIASDLLITRERRVNKINKLIPIKKLKIKSLLTKGIH